MIEKLFDIKYPDLHSYIEEWHLDVMHDWQKTVDKMMDDGVGTISLGNFLQVSYPEILETYQEFIKDYVKDFFRDLLKQEKE